MAMIESELEPADSPPSVAEAIALKQARALDERALRTILEEARNANGFLPGPLPRALLERAVELAELGPTSMNSLPVRYVFVESAEAKARLRPALSETNRAKTMAAPATAIVAFDTRFYEKFAQTLPMRPGARDRFADPERAAQTQVFARDNALLQMGYFIIAARALGLDCGAMGGFDRAAVDAEFFADGQWASLYLINLGYDDQKQVFPRLPRLAPAEIVRFE
jgi:3-hydroxypropanoate dehydrogenase